LTNTNTNQLINEHVLDTIAEKTMDAEVLSQQTITGCNFSWSLLAIDSIAMM
jgi:hypothetical protein